MEIFTNVSSTGGTRNTRYTGSRVHSLIKQNTNDKINKLESQVFDISNVEITKVLDQSDFQKVRRSLARDLSNYGESALYLLPFGDTFYVSILDTIQYSMVGKTELMVSGIAKTTFEYEGAHYPIHVKIEYKNNIPTLSRWIEAVKGTEGEIELIQVADEYQYDMAKLPVEVFYNNEEKASDISYAGVEGDIERLSYLDGELVAQWEITKSMPYYNTNFTDNDPTATTANLKNGSGQIVETSFNAKVREGHGILPSSGAYLSQYQLISALEEDIRNKLHLKSSISGESGANKHGLEMVMREQLQSEQLMMSKSMRQKHWQNFFDKISQLLSVENVVIDLKLSPIEQAKIDMLEVQVKESQARVELTKSQAKAATMMPQGGTNE